ncbi:tigger transposable element-derived protein 2-like [Leptopilina heterotoma]|uniref:tigger transposable element-derived protein 2-like n=1 Tax=Leptopilina heterotoma TaxID=63436 RepID=UPI001CA800DF|nr:tigger transposable element-derived protein 2-like [Leptopilina heterotoma]
MGILVSLQEIEDGTLKIKDVSEKDLDLAIIRQNIMESLNYVRKTLKAGGQKRKRKVITLEKKLEIIKQLEKGATAVSLSKIYNVLRTTISDLKKRTNEIVQSEGIPLSGPIVSAKALFFNEELNGDANFKATNGWLEKFKNRHGIRELNIEEEKMSAASVEIVNDFKVKFQKIIDENGFTRDQVYNADETGLNYKALPTKTLAPICEKYAPGFKMQKQRITALVCANASGKNQIPLLLIGKSKRPRCFKGLNMNALPCTYAAQKNAWMSQEIFKQWFNMVFVPNVQKDLKSKNLPPKAILVLDNAPSHPEASSLTSDDGNITCYFLPANTTSLIQPMDQSVIETFKQYWKAYNLKHVIDNSSDAWAEVSEETLKRCSNKLWPKSSDEFQENIVSESDNVTNDILTESVDIFSLNEDEVREYVVETDADLEGDTNIEYDGSDKTENRVNTKDFRKEAKEVCSNMQKFIEWYEQQDDENVMDNMILRRLRTYATNKSQILLVEFLYNSSENEVAGEELLQEREDPPFEAMEISSESDYVASEDEVAGEEPLQEGREIANAHRLVVEVNPVAGAERPLFQGFENNIRLHRILQHHNELHAIDHFVKTVADNVCYARYARKKLGTEETPHDYAHVVQMDLV